MHFQSEAIMRDFIIQVISLSCILNALYEDMYYKIVRGGNKRVCKLMNFQLQLSKDKQNQKSNPNPTV